jgi:hypothetical protein
MFLHCVVAAPFASGTIFCCGLAFVCFCDGQFRDASLFLGIALPLAAVVALMVYLANRCFR